MEMPINNYFYNHRSLCHRILFNQSQNSLWTKTKHTPSFPIGSFQVPTLFPCMYVARVTCSIAHSELTSLSQLRGSYYHQLAHLCFLYVPNCLPMLAWKLHSRQQHTKQISSAYQWSHQSLSPKWCCLTWVRGCWPPHLTHTLIPNQLSL